MKSHEDEAVIKRQGISPGLFFFFLSFVFFVVVVAISWAAPTACGGSRLGDESELLLPACARSEPNL